MAAVRRISVIVPFYNAKDDIRRCLASLIAQDYPDFEVIAIDDASTDNATEALPETLRHDSRLVILRNDVNSGPGVARNRGINRATGEIILLLDADSWVEQPDWLSRHAAAHAGQYDLIIGGGIVGIGKGPIAHADRYCHWVTNIPFPARNSIFAGRPAPFWQMSYHLVTNNMSFLRATYAKIGRFDPAFRTGEDVDFCARARALGTRLQFLHDLRVMHRDRETLHSFLRCFYNMGKDRVPVWRRHKFRHSWLLPNNIGFALILGLPLTCLMPIQPLCAWWPHEKRIVLYLPLIYLACLATMAGIIRYHIDGLVSSRLALEPRARRKGPE